MVNKLYERSIIIYDPNHENAKDNYVKTRWISGAFYNVEAGYIEVVFADYIRPYLTQLKSHFTRYGLKNIIHLTSIYAIRLYEITIKWLNIGKESYGLAIADFRHMMQLDDKYREISNLKNRVLHPSIEQINQYTDITLRFSQKKQGRQITHLVFTFEKNAKATVGDTSPLLALSVPPDAEDWESIYQTVSVAQLITFLKWDRDYVALDLLQRHGYQSPELRPYIKKYLQHQRQS